MSVQNPPLDPLETLDEYHRVVKATILNFQNPVTGLLPASLYRGQFVPGKPCADAWIRDNVYSILSVWGLSLAYKKRSDWDEDKSRHYELEQSVVKLMRGLLQCMMQQIEKVESFKKSQRQEDSLHAKYSYKTGQTVVGDGAWGHLQIDAVSLFLLVLGQMTASGIRLVYTKDEVDFVQNLVFYIETAYRVSDFGVFERGDKTNRGVRELNASSIGMAKAALEVVNELDLFGSVGGPGSIIHVQADQIRYCKTVLHSMLPRESSSKECSASLLSIVSFPAFAVENPSLIEATKDEIVKRLEGRYGCKRFLRDGHHCENEDRERLHYEMYELEKFEHIECEWPLFFCFLVLDGVYNFDRDQVIKYTNLLKQRLIETNDNIYLLPELFFVPKDKIEAEKATPHSQERLYGDHVPHMWTHSLYILGQLLAEGFVAPGELDPLNRRYVSAPKPELVVQVALIAEDEAVKELLARHGVVSQTTEEARPTKILSAACLSWIYGQLGKNKKLGLSGRPKRNIGTIGNSSMYRVGGDIYAFTPQFFDYHQFYLCLDNDLLVDQFKTNVEYLRSNWYQPGRPTMTLPITHALLEDSMESSIGKVILQISSGYLYSVRIRVGKLSELLSRSSIKQLDFVDPKKLEDIADRFHDPSISPKCGDVLGHSHESQDDSKPPVDSPPGVGGFDRRESIYGALRRLSSFPMVSGDIFNRSSRTVSSSSCSECDEDVESGLELMENACLQDGLTYQDFDEDEERQRLEQADDINEQAIALHRFYHAKGYDYDVMLHGREGWTVKKLLEELYHKACHLKLWAILRHTAGMLHKGIEGLEQQCNEILVNQKQISVGLPHFQREVVIKQPLPAKEIKQLIYSAYGEDSISAVLTQEILSYLAMFFKSDPSLFKEMLRIKVGLIVELLASEYGRVLGETVDDPASRLMELSPYQIKLLLFCILSGKEFRADEISQHKSRHGSRRKSCIDRVKSGLGNVAWSSSETLSSEAGGECTDSEDEHSTTGSWLRRRRLDGALNRVPDGFYLKIWHVLKRCKGFSVTVNKMMLEQKLLSENTSKELKFALTVEEELNKIVFPEYRQLVVETIMLIYMFLEHDVQYVVNHVVKIDEVVAHANQLFLSNQRQANGDAVTCCAGDGDSDEIVRCGAPNNICQFFYDSAPSGTYGTMTYLMQAILNVLYAHLKDSDDVMRLAT